MKHVLKRLPFVLVLLALASTSAVMAQPDGLVGEAAPPLEITSWVVAPEAESIEDLGGRVVVLLLDGAFDPGDEAAVHRWNDLRAARWEDGLRIVALLAEEPAEAPAAAACCVAVGRAPAYGDGGTPRVVVVAADGAVAWEGAPDELTDDVLAPLLRKAKTFYLKRLSPEVKPIVSVYKKGQLTKAAELAAASDHADAAYVRERIESLKTYWKARAEAATEIGNPAEAAEALGLLARHLEDAEAATALKDLKADRASKREIAAAETYGKLREELRKAGGKEKKVAAFVKKAEKAALKYEGTRGAERVLRLVASVKADPAIEAIRAFIAKERISTAGGSWRTRLPKPPQVAFASGKTYFWNLETNQGAMRIRFLPDVAPMHVSSTIYLTELGYYDGLTFHRVIPGFMAQGGCPLGNGTGSPGYKYAGEFDRSARHERAGTLSMANSGPGTDGSQFFITFGPTAHLDDKHTVFGLLDQGRDTLEKLEKLGTSGGSTKERVLIEEATISVE